MRVYQISSKHRIFKENHLFFSDWRSVLLSKRHDGWEALLYAYVTVLTAGLKMEQAAPERAPFLLMCKAGYVRYSFKSM